MNERVISRKLNKLNKVWQEEGTLALFKFIYQKIRNKYQGNLSYRRWLKKNELKDEDIIKARQQIDQMKLRPKFSVIMPVYNVEAKWLEKAIESVRKQIYPDWELCIADDASTQPHIRPLLEKYSKLDSRIKVIFREENGHISVASNSALELATGDYVALLDNDDELTIDALFENAKLINSHPEADFIYSDEDKIDTKGKLSGPFFKPDWSPEYFHACMYTCHLGVYRTSLIGQIGGFRSEYDGSQDYDLVLRVVEKTTNIFHIPKILYHWRIIPSSVTSGEQAKPWAYVAAKNALAAMLERSNYPGWVEESSQRGFYRVRRHIVGQPLVSIIIPSAAKCISIDGEEVCLLEQCLESIKSLTTYTNIEIILVDGYDIPDAILARIEYDKLKLVRCNKPFNFSMRINLGISESQGDFLLILNDDIQVLTPDWIESMLELAQQESIGAVGCKLLFPDEKIQHCGVVILNGNPGHPYYNESREHPGYFLSNLINRNYIAVTGACLMVKKSKFKEVGTLNEDLPLNYNDVDFCLRLFRAGYRNVVTPYVEMLHFESASRGDNWQQWELDKLHALHSGMPYLQFDPYYNSNLSQSCADFSLD